MAVFAVRTAKGPNWDHTRGIREQPDWPEHAAFADALTEAGTILLGGPVITGDDEDIALLAVEAEDEAAIHTAFAKDPWTTSGVFRLRSIWPWTLWLDGKS